MSKGNVADKKNDMSAAEELIREVSEGVIARNSPRRRKNKQTRAEPVAKAAEIPSAPSVPAPPAEQRSEPPVIKQAPPEPAVLLPRSDSGPRNTVALICYEDPGSPIAAFAARAAEGLAARGHSIHIFARKPLQVGHDKVRTHELGDPHQENLVERVHEFTHRVHSAFRQHLGNGNGVSVLGFEWASIPSLLELVAEFRLPSALSLHSLESMRSDMTSDISKRIQEIEFSGLRQAGKLLFHDPKTAEKAAQLIPEVKDRLVAAVQPFPTHEFKGIEDAGAIKARIHVGPIDPLVLFIGDLDERHAPDVLMKAVAPVLKNNKQVRFAFVGDGTLQWPLRVHARYLLLEHAVRILGHVGGQQLFELIQAAEMICVPSRDKTEDWPILAAWAAKKPVVATHNTGTGLIQHEQNGVLVYANENSFVWGVERVLFDEVLRKKLGENGRKTLEERCGSDTVALQLEDLLTLKAGAAN
ncbi:MAG TPA: glycosyltransferase family 4 protein [Planctomycetota bacterium]|nr:glycosyltransferase family 4 protein [Planctomycetota bacterium]